MIHARFWAVQFLQSFCLAKGRFWCKPGIQCLVSTSCHQFQMAWNTWHLAEWQSGIAIIGDRHRSHHARWRTCSRPRALQPRSKTWHIWGFLRIKTPMSKWFRHVSNVWKTMWAKNKKIQKEQRSAFGCRRHCRVYVEVEIVVEMASFSLTGSSPHDAQPSHSSSSLSSWCDGDGGEVSRASSLVQIHISQSFLTSEGFQPQTMTDQICQSCLMETSHIWSFSETFVKKNREAFVPPLCGHRRQRTCHPPQVSVLSAQLSKEKSTSVKSVINQWTKAGKEGRIWKKQGMIFRTTCQGRRMCTLKQSQLQLGQPSFGNEEDSRMRRRIKRRMRVTTPDPARLEPLRAKTPPKKDWFNHRPPPKKFYDWICGINYLPQAPNMFAKAEPTPGGRTQLW